MKPGRSWKTVGVGKALAHFCSAPVSERKLFSTLRYGQEYPELGVLRDFEHNPVEQKGYCVFERDGAEVRVPHEEVFRVLRKYQP